MNATVTAIHLGGRTSEREFRRRLIQRQNRHKAGGAGSSSHAGVLYRRTSCILLYISEARLLLLCYDLNACTVSEAGRDIRKTPRSRSSRQHRATAILIPRPCYH